MVRGRAGTKSLKKLLPVWTWYRRTFRISNVVLELTYRSMQLLLRKRDRVSFDGNVNGCASDLFWQLWHRFLSVSWHIAWLSWYDVDHAHGLKWACCFERGSAFVMPCADMSVKPLRSHWTIERFILAEQNVTGLKCVTKESRQHRSVCKLLRFVACTGVQRQQDLCVHQAGTRWIQI